MEQLLRKRTRQVIFSLGMSVSYQSWLESCTGLFASRNLVNYKFERIYEKTELIFNKLVIVDMIVHD